MATSSGEVGQPSLTTREGEAGGAIEGAAAAFGPTVTTSTSVPDPLSPATAATRLWPSGDKAMETLARLLGSIPGLVLGRATDFNWAGSATGKPVKKGTECPNPAVLPTKTSAPSGLTVIPLSAGTEGYGRGTTTSGGVPGGGIGRAGPGGDGWKGIRKPNATASTRMAASGECDGGVGTATGTGGFGPLAGGGPFAGTSGPWIMGCVVVVDKMQTRQRTQTSPQVRTVPLELL
jgi:hypothetical protein